MVDQRPVGFAAPVASAALSVCGYLRAGLCARPPCALPPATLVLLPRASLPQAAKNTTPSNISDTN